MSEIKEHIEQIGWVKATGAERIKILLSGSGCSACHNSLCMLGDSKAKEVEVMVNNQAFQIGEEVLVRINPSSGYKAVMLLYVIPFLLMIGFMALSFQLGFNEGIAGLSAILVLAPYFGILYLFRKTLRNQCAIDVTKR